MPLDLIAIVPSLALEPMEAFARALALRLLPGDTVTLRGEVGAGKTAFARALIRAIATDSPDVTSPTFNLMQSYDVKTGLLWHLDLYRIENAPELEGLGLEELWEHIVLVEWPEIASKRLPDSRLDIAFGFTQFGRSLTLSGNDAWRERLAGLC